MKVSNLLTALWWRQYLASSLWAKHQSMEYHKVSFMKKIKTQASSQKLMVVGLFKTQMVLWISLTLASLQVATQHSELWNIWKKEILLQCDNARYHTSQLLMRPLWCWISSSDHIHYTVQIWHHITSTFPQIEGMSLWTSVWLK